MHLFYFTFLLNFLAIPQIFADWVRDWCAASRKLFFTSNASNSETFPTTSVYAYGCRSSIIQPYHTRYEHSKISVNHYPLVLSRIHYLIIQCVECAEKHTNFQLCYYATYARVYKAVANTSEGPEEATLATK